MTDDFEENTMKQQLHYCQDIAKQIIKISEVLND